MKKIVLLTLLIFSFILINGQNIRHDNYIGGDEITEKSAIKVIDELQKEGGIKKVKKFIDQYQNGFILDNYIYVLSYEKLSKNKRRSQFWRRGYLYARKLHKIENWVSGQDIKNSIYTHNYFNGNRVYSTIKGKKIEKVETDNGTCFIMFVNIERVYEGRGVDKFTHFIYFYPEEKYSNGLYHFGFKEWENRLTLFKYEKRKGNVFYDANSDYRFFLDYKHDYDLNDGKLMPVVELVLKDEKI